MCHSVMNPIRTFVSLWCVCTGIVPPAASVGVKEPVECDGVAEDDEVFVDCPEAAQEGQMVLEGGATAPQHAYRHIPVGTACSPVVCATFVLHMFPCTSNMHSLSDN